MKTVSYTWKVIISIITIGIIVALLEVASNRFETAVLSALILIYINIVSFFSTWGMATFEINESLNTEIQGIKKSINKITPLSEEERRAIDDEEYTEEYKKELEAEKAKEKEHLKIKYYINLGFQFIVYLIALGYLFSSL